jgi:Protein of unknown function (DUF1549)/Protein of unknown function (DUF1553)
MWRIILLSIVAATAFAADEHCPAYPESQRRSDQLQLKKEQAAFAFAKTQRKHVALTLSASNNFIDDYIFGKMVTDGVESASPASDAEIVRRLSLDLTGRIPSPELVLSFLNDTDPNKRAKLVDSLIASDAFTDYWTFIFGNQFEVTSRYYSYVGIPGRNLFYNYLRDFVAKDRSYKDVATEMITADGDSHEVAPANFLVRGYQQGDPVQDTYDTITDRITTKFLGIQTQCVSCHDGRRHLEEINTYLTARKRAEFWRQSAFVSRMGVNILAVDAFFQQSHVLFTDKSAGGYNTYVDPNNPGPRPARSGGPYSPRYMFSGEAPGDGKWRDELARLITSDRQFARAAVNYLWADFFKYGIVDPPNGWDLARIDPKNPPPAPWTLQPTHPELLERLADEFINSNYSIRHMIELIAKSNAYQLSSRYEGQWRPEYERYFAKHFPRRLYAEEVYDAVATATETQVPMYVEGFKDPFYYAVQLPDPSEPRNNGSIATFLSTFGRGDWWVLPRNTQTNVLQVLYQMNDNMINFRTFGSRNVTTRVTRIMQSKLGDTDAINALFVASIGRNATDAEIALLKSKKTTNYEQWLSDIQWALLNKIEFVFSN